MVATVSSHEDTTMQEYRVVYEMYVEADSAFEAAEAAYDRLCEPMDTPPLLSVTGPDGRTECIDIESDDETPDTAELPRTIDPIGYVVRRIVME
jgi:hypothetical protein